MCFALLAAIPLLTSMTVEEKVGQTLMVHVQGEVVNQDAKSAIQDLHVGGIIYYTWANGLTSPKQVKELSASLQELASIPLFIAVDQEGGVVSRLTKGFTQFPGARALGIVGDADLTEKVSFASGMELRAVGVNCNFAPVVDIASEPASYIGIRSAGTTAQKVIETAQPQMAGYRRAKVITSLKHFPGHGDVLVDSHVDLPILMKSEAELKTCELLPYMTLAKSADMIMTGHIAVPALDTKACATLSPAILEGLLRKELQYKGVIISDSLVMDGLLKQCASIEEAAIRAFNAGCDILLLGGKRLVGVGQYEVTTPALKKVTRALVQAVHDGTISEEKLNASVQRILDLKASYIQGGSAPRLEEVGSVEHRALAEEVATRSVQQVKNEPFEWSKGKVLVLAPAILKENLARANMQGIGEEREFFFTESLAPDALEQSKVHLITGDLVVVFSYNAWKNHEQKALIKSLIDSGKSVAVIAARDTQDAELFPTAKVVITTSSPSLPSLQAAVNLLRGHG